VSHQPRAACPVGLISPLTHIVRTGQPTAIRQRTADLHTVGVGSYVEGYLVNHGDPGSDQASVPRFERKKPRSGRIDATGMVR
jgi:hypothetical protein